MTKKEDAAGILFFLSQDNYIITSMKLLPTAPRGYAV